MPFCDVVRVGGGCGPLYLNGPEVDCLLCQWGGCAPYWGPRGMLIQYINMVKNKTPKVEKYSYYEYYFLVFCYNNFIKTIITVNNRCFAKKVILL